MTGPVYIGQALPAKVITVSGVSLFAIAARELGDATQWYRIAALNPQACTDPTTGLLNPWITAPVQLKIPGPGKSNGGIPTS